MIELIETHSNELMAMKIAGVIVKADVEQIIEAAQKKMQQCEKLALYVELEDFDGDSLIDLYQDLQIGLPDYQKLDKKAVVSNKAWIGNLVEQGGTFFPGVQIRHFAPYQRTEAMRWAAQH